MKPRDGLSLLEVILAIAILAGAMAATSELVRLGVRQAEESRELSQGQLLCESKMEEILAGVLPAESVAETVCEMNSRWLYSIEVLPLEQPELLEVQVTVTQAETARLQPLTFTLIRWLIDPDYVAEMAALEEEAAAAESSEASDNATGDMGAATGGPDA